MKARPYAFTLKKDRDSKTMPSIRPLPGIANEGQTLSFHPEHHGSVLSSTRTLSTYVATPACQGRCCQPPTITYTVADGPTGFVMLKEKTPSLHFRLSTQEKLECPQITKPIKLKRKRAQNANQPDAI